MSVILALGKTELLLYSLELSKSNEVYGYYHHNTKLLGNLGRLFVPFFLDGVEYIMSPYDKTACFLLFGLIYYSYGSEYGFEGNIYNNFCHYISDIPMLDGNLYQLYEKLLELEGEEYNSEFDKISSYFHEDIIQYDDYIGYLAGGLYDILNHNIEFLESNNSLGGSMLGDIKISI